MKWISVNDRLPEYDKWGLVTDGTYVQEGRREKTDSSGEHWQVRNAVTIESKKITHWMPLPEPPKD